jgi:hypothetical protein
VNARGWIATKGDRVLHLSEADGWTLHQVVGPFEQAPAVAREADAWVEGELVQGHVSASQWQLSDAPTAKYNTPIYVAAPPAEQAPDVVKWQRLAFEWHSRATFLASVPAVRQALGRNHVGKCSCVLCEIDREHAAMQEGARKSK